jgi:hypothetical protein
VLARIPALNLAPTLKMETVEPFVEKAPLQVRKPLKTVGLFKVEVVAEVGVLKAAAVTELVALMSTVLMAAVPEVTPAQRLVLNCAFP